MAESRRTPLHELDFSILQQCIHCGLCLPSCPTYRETGRERNSPRGRIALMRSIAEDHLGVTAGFADEMSYCLGCLACTTACPAGVDYAGLFEASRQAVAEEPLRFSRRTKLVRWLLLRQLFTRPRLLRLVARLLRLYQRSGCAGLVRRSGALRLLPRRWRELEPSTPKISAAFSDDLIATWETPARVRHRVALLTGCVQDVAGSAVNRATVDVLLANDCAVFTPRLQGCCGSLHAHNGDHEAARMLARRLIDQIDAAGLDAVISNAAGCGSHLKHYAGLLADDPAYAARAAHWASKVRDVSEWLVQIGFRPPTAAPFGAPGEIVTYHDACHLCHGQGILEEPRALLRSIPGLELRESAESTWCCGSAGIYAITQPATAGALRNRKWQHLDATGASIVAMGNPGCSLHLQRRSGETARAEILHPVELLARAYAAEGQKKGAPQ